MKRLLISILLTPIFALEAQVYRIISSPVSGSSAYEFEIQPKPNTNTPDLADQDLITWIFPDGQFKLWKVETDATTGAVINNSNKVTWQPYITSPSGPDSIIAYVARKGKPGNPSFAAEPVTIPPITTPGAPLAFAMSTTVPWQINQSWEFSPGKEALLIISYKAPPTCTPSNKIELAYNTNQVDTVTNQIFAYQNETVVTDNSGIPQRKIILSNLQTNDIVNHVFVKLRLDFAQPLGTFFPVALTANVCGTTIDTTLLYPIKGNPHDPNEKIVNHRIVCPNNSNNTDLRYSIKFQNDGDAPVDSVEVVDNLPSELIRNTFALGNVPDFFRVYGGFDWVGQNGFYVLFKDLNLPGLKQVNPHYAYDQTTYGFDFTICTQSNLAFNTGFDNTAEIYFFDNQNNKLPPVYTNAAQVSVESVPSCYAAQVSCKLAAFTRTSLISNLSVFPNPFEESMSIQVELIENTYLGIELRDVNGRLLNRIADGEYLSGAHRLDWNAGALPSGIYVLVIHTKRGSAASRIIKI